MPSSAPRRPRWSLANSFKSPSLQYLIQSTECFVISKESRHTIALFPEGRQRKLKTKWQQLIFGLVILTAAGLTIGQLAFTSAQDSLKADAGPDQTVMLEVSDSVTGQVATDRVTISLGHNQSAPSPTPLQCPQPTATASASSGYPGDTITVTGYGWLPGSTVTLALIDDPAHIDLGSVDNVPDSGDWETTFTVPDEPWAYWLRATQNFQGCNLFVQSAFEILQSDPAESQGVTGANYIYEAWGRGGSSQHIGIGKLDDGRWYVRSYGSGEDYLWGQPAIATCHLGTHWAEVRTDGFTDREGCVGAESNLGAESNIGDLVVLVSGDNGGWVISDRNTYQKLVTLTPRTNGDLYALVQSVPLK